MSKIIKIGSLLLCILLLITLINSNVINSTEWTTHPYCTKGTNNSFNRQEVKNFSGIDRVYVDMTSGSSYYTASLFQPNTFCIQHGVQISDGTTWRGWYSVGPEIESVDPGISWILYKGTHSGITWTHEHEYQSLLWSYLKANQYKTNAEVNNMLEGLTAVQSCSSLLWNYLNSYMDQVNNFNPNVSIVEEKEKNRVKITVEGCSDYDLYYISNDGTEKKIEEKTTNNIYYLDKEEISSSKAETRIVARQNIYRVKYRILKRTASQRLLVVTHTGIDKLEKEDSASLNLATYSVSLEKYVTAINGLKAGYYRIR